MLRYIAKRLLLMIPVVIGMSVFVFAMMRLIPGDIAYVSLGAHATEEAVEAYRHRTGLDQPLHVQYLRWVGDFMSGEFGVSLTTGVSIREEMLRRLPVTLQLTAMAIILATLIGLPAGLIAARRPNSKMDLAVSTLGLTGLSLPNFWLGTMLVLLFAVQRHILPPSGFVRFTENPVDNLRLLVLPTISLAVVSASVILRMTRASAIEVMRQDYVTTAQAKGASDGVLMRRHILKNSLIPVVTVIGMEAGYIFGAAFLIEAVFLIPGVATWSLYAIQKRDYTVLQATTMVVLIVFMSINLAVDILYTYLDPRLRLGGREEG